MTFYKVRGRIWHDERVQRPLDHFVPAFARYTVLRVYVINKGCCIPHHPGNLGYKRGLMLCMAPCNASGNSLLSFS